MAKAKLFLQVMGAPRQLKPELLMLPVWLSFKSTVSATTHTHVHTQMKSKPFLCLLNEENENMKYRTPQMGVT